MKLIVTPFNLTILALVLLSIFKLHLFNFWTLDGGSSLVGLYAVGALIISLFLFVADRLLMKNLTYKKAFLIEIVLVAIGLLILWNLNIGG
ncbi:hypothetical protein [Salinimicrobium flavum]|uniref:Uncharacterized protein n=1 Tax=Salinimicrobium flavum TaxID=1737065 RepID=A0ABW5IXR3_9FLAO